MALKDYVLCYGWELIQGLAILMQVAGFLWLCVFLLTLWVCRGQKSTSRSWNKYKARRRMR